MASNNYVSEYTMVFTANTSQAKNQLQELRNSLNNLSSLSAQVGKNPLGLTEELQKAVTVANQLKINLENATNVNTGQLDLGKFTQSMKKSGMSLKKYQAALRELGPEGDRAFSQLAQSISIAELPIKRSSKLLTEFATTLKNTTKWQISSSILHGFMGAIQSAYGYAQDLNESLNNIRIVTGKNTDQMAKFAKEANKAAKELNTTTTSYTDASLIYYQQGLSSQQVKERTDVTIKMANVARESAETVSDQMTSVWNNFYDGSKSLEYYADVMTALGAATASSTDEIAQGLEKFAAIADTVGLSYEYATSALATVTAETRQSAEVVGTAFKTMFARIQGLKLGETLEDGTTFNQYSEALMAVGINIKDANGELKNMDTILNEMGTKWQTLNRDEQVALAQKVAGVRQYSQLVALMDNWDKFQVNLEIAEDSEGTLQKQADIYAESWEAASKKVKASLETVYQQILNDKSFIKILNVVAKIIDKISDLIDAFGGFGNVIMGIGAIILKVFQKEIATSLSNTYDRISSVSKKSQQEQMRQKEEANLLLMRQAADTGTASGAARADAYSRQAQEQLAYIRNAERMTEEERTIYQIRMDQSKEINQQAIKAAETLEIEEQKLNTLKLQAEASQRKEDLSKNIFKRDSATSYINKNIVQNINPEEMTQEQATQVANQLKNLKEGFSNLEDPSFMSEAFNKNLNDLINSLENCTEKTKEGLKSWNKYSEGVERAAKTASNILERKSGKQNVEDYRKDIDSYIESSAKNSEVNEKAENYSKGLVGDMNGIPEKQAKISDGFVGMASSVMSFGFALQQLSSAWQTIRDPNASGWDKFLSIITTLGMTVPMVVTGFKSFKTAFSTLDVALTKNINKKFLNKKATDELTKSTERSSQATDTNEKEVNEESIAIDNNTKSKGKFSFFKKGKSKTEIKGTPAKNVATAGSEGAAAAGGSLLPILIGIAAVIGSITLAIKFFKKEATAAENAKKEAQQVSDSFDSAKEKYQELGQTISSYSDAVTEIKKMKEGTEEFKKAIFDANQQALELIKTYDNLKYTTDENGLINIDEESLEEVQEEQFRQVQDLQSAKMTADKIARDKQAKADEVALGRKLKTNQTKFQTDDFVSGATGTAVGAGAGAAIGAAFLGTLGTAIPVLGNAAGVVIGSAVGSVIGTAGGALAATIKNDYEDSEKEIFNQLVELRKERGDSIFADDDAFRNLLENELKIDDTKLVDSLVKQREEIQKNTEAVNKNTEQNKIENRTKISERYGEEIKKENLNEKQQVFLTDTLSKTLEEKSSKNYDEKYTEGKYNNRFLGWGQDKDLQKLFMEKMGYSKAVGGIFDNTAEFYDSEGNSVGEYHEDTMRQILAEMDALDELNSDDAIGKNAELVRQLSQRDKELTQIYGDNIENYDSYKNALIQYGNSLGFTEDEMMNYINNAGENTKAAAKIKISKNLYNQLPEEQQTGLTEDLINNFVNNLGDQLSDEQIELAIDASANSKSVDEFARKLENAINDASLQGIESSLETAQSILEDGELNTEELKTLKEDDKFKEFLESQSITLAEFTTSTYTEQYAIVSEYYSKLRELQDSVIGKQNDNYQKQIIDLQAIIDYKNTMANKDFETAEAIKEQFSDINFDAYKNTKITDLNSEITELQNKMEELQDKEIEISLSWEGIDVIEGGYKKLGSMSKALQEDAKQVGDEYQLTAQSAKEWMKVYPDLFKQAEVSEDGIISLNKETVDQYIKGQEDQVDANADAKIQQLQAEKEKLLAQKTIIQQDLELAKNKAVGEENLSKASADYLMRLRAGLTDYYIKQGKTDAQADELALKDMGINRVQYSKLVADACATDSLAQQDSSKEGSIESLKWYERWAVNIKTLFATVKDAFKSLFTEGKLSFEWDKNKAEISAEYQLDGEKVSTTQISGDAYTSSLNTQNYDFKSGDSLNNIDNSEAQAAADALSQVTSNLTDTYESQLEMIDGRVDTVDAQILALQALKNQDAKDYGETDVDKVTGKDKEKKEEKKEDKKEDKKKKLDEEIERYHEINQELDDLEKHLSRVEKNTDRAFGQTKLDLYDQQLSDINSEMNLHNQKLKEAEAYKLSDQAKLNAFGATYNSSGKISNYDQMVAREVNAYNAAIATGDDDTIEAAEERYEQFQKYLQNYEESLNTVEEEEEKLADLVDKAADIKLAKIQYKLEVNIELNEDSLKQLEYQLKKIEHKSFNQAQSIDILQNQAQIHKNNAQYYANSVEEILSSKGLNKAQIKAVQSGDMSAIAGVDFTAEEVEQIRSNVEGIQNENEALLDIDQTIREKIGEAYDEWNEKIDENLEKFNYYDSVMQHYDNILDLLGKKRTNLSAEEAKAIGLAQVANKKNQVAALQDALKEQEKIEAQQRKNIANAKTEEDKKMWEEELNKTIERKKDLQDQILTSTEDLIKKISDIYKRYLQDSLDEFEESISGTFGSLDKLQEAYDRRKTLNDQYIKDYKKIYELNKLNRQLDKALDETSSVKNKDKIKKLQEEINRAQRDGVKLSEYDLEVLQKKYDLKMAEMALDNIKNAKTQVRLVRNQEGTYGYVYTANEEDVDNAIQNYEDKLYELQDLNEQYIEEMGAAFIQTQQEMVDALSKIQLEDFESYADYKKAVDETASYYQERLDYYSKEMQKGLDNNKTLYYEEYNTFKGYNEQKDLSYKQFTTSFHQTTIGQLRRDINSIAEYQKLVNTALYGGGDGSSVTSDSLLGKMYNGYKQWEININENVLKPLGIEDMDSLKDNIIMRLYGSDPNSVLRILGSGANGVEDVWRNSVRNILGFSEDDFKNYKGNLQELIERKGGLNDILGGWKANVWGSMYSDDDSIVNGSSKAKKSVTNLAKQATNDYKNLSNKTTNWQKQWSTDYQKAINKTDALTNSYLKLVNELSKKHNYPTEEKKIITKNITEYSQIGNPPSSSSSSSSGNSNNRNGNSNNGGVDPLTIIPQAILAIAMGTEIGKLAEAQTRGPNGTPEKYDTPTLNTNVDVKRKNTNLFGQTSFSKIGTLAAGTRVIVLDSETHKDRDAGTYIKFIKVRYGQNQEGWIPAGALKPGTYDTGGYTGSWGNNGKLAVLHEKELVLNKQDTSNILDVVSVVRNLVNNLKFPQILTAIESMEPQSISKIDNSKTISQEVNIQADFPGVSDHNEIELALQGLMERASQYAYRD